MTRIIYYVEVHPVHHPAHHLPIVIQVKKFMLIFDDAIKFKWKCSTTFLPYFRPKPCSHFFYEPFGAFRRKNKLDSLAWCMSMLDVGIHATIINHSAASKRKPDEVSDGVGRLLMPSDERWINFFNLKRERKDSTSKFSRNDDGALSSLRLIREPHDKFLYTP